MRANFLGSEVGQAVLTRVSEFSPEHFKSHFIKDFVTVIMEPYNVEFRTPNYLIVKYLFAH